jgi:hypothetical protein
MRNTGTRLAHGFARRRQSSISQTSQSGARVMSNSVTAFETISLTNLSFVAGGQGPAPAQPPQNPNGITTRDVVEVGGRATEAVLSRGASVVGNLGQAYRQFNDQRVGNGFWDRAAYGFTGLFGIDPLKK